MPKAWPRNPRNRSQSATRNHTAGGPALAHALDQRVEALRGLVRRALRSWETDAVHHARVSTRRLRAAVDLLQRLLPEEPRRAFGKALRKLRRALGPLRDLDVMLIHLGEMKVPPAS